MQVQYTEKRIVREEKYLTLLDQFVLDFIHIRESGTPYVIVSGYVAILFGRSRGTEDVGILVPRMEKDQFLPLFAALAREGYEFLNAEDAEGLYDMLTQGMGIRAAKKDQFIPNIELKFLKDTIDQQVFHERIEVEFDGKKVFISPIDIQIAYKLRLGSEKDTEDALYLFEIFQDNLDPARLQEWFRTFHVRGDEYGIII